MILAKYDYEMKNPERDLKMEYLMVTIMKSDNNRLIITSNSVVWCCYSI